MLNMRGTYGGSWSLPSKIIGPAPEGRPQKKSKGVPPAAGPQALLKKDSESDKKMVLWGSRARVAVSLSVTLYS